MKNVRVSLVVQKVPTTNEQIQLELYEGQQLGGVSTQNPAKLNFPKDNVRFSNTRICQFVLSIIMKQNNQGAVIGPHLTNHFVRAAPRSYHCDYVEARHSKVLTGHNQEQSIESYNVLSSFQ